MTKSLRCSSRTFGSHRVSPRAGGPREGSSHDVASEKDRSGVRTLVPFDERNSDGFFGRDRDVAALDKVLAGDVRVVALTGLSGVGKTSLLRAGLTPVLAKRGLTVITLTTYADLERELVRAISQVGIAPPVPGQDAADYLGDVARAVKGGVVVILDQLEQVLTERGRADGRVVEHGRRDATRVLEEGGPRTRLILSIDERRLLGSSRSTPPSGPAPAPARR